MLNMLSQAVNFNGQDNFAGFLLSSDELEMVNGGVKWADLLAYGDAVYEFGKGFVDGWSDASK
jgi:hypothetical protein